MIWNSLAYFRKQWPNRVAIVLSGGGVTYKRFCGDVARFTQVLREQVPKDAKLVSVAVRGNYLHWLCVLALERLRITSVSSVKAYDEAFSPDLVISDIDEDTTVPVLKVDTAWLGVQVDPAHFNDRDDPSDFPLRLVASSGTTGKPKRILLTADLLRRRIMQVGVDYGIGPETRVHTPMGFGTVGGYQLPLATWLRGGAVVMAAEAMTSAAVPDRLRPNCAVLATSTYEILVNQMKDREQAFPGVRFFVGGSPVSQTLAARGRRRLSEHLEILYGSTEQGMVSLGFGGDPVQFSVGYPLPYVEVQVVDKDDREVPRGQEGQLRTRSPYGVSGYHEDPEATAKAFKDGWFYPSDLAVQREDGLLLIIGRTDEVFNLGGRKVAPSVVEEVALNCPGVADAGSCEVASVDRGQVCAVGVVPGEGFDLGRVKAEVADKLGKARFTVVVVPHIPRNEMGKIVRRELAKVVYEAGATQTAATAAKADA